MRTQIGAPYMSLVDINSIPIDRTGNKNRIKIEAEDVAELPLVHALACDLYMPPLTSLSNLDAVTS
jgi:hypothetical protein